MRILIAEDDQVLADGLLRTLRSSGAVVSHVANGSEADTALLTSSEFDLLILDLGLPKVHGLEVLKRLRGRGDALPVLILTAADSIEERVQGALLHKSEGRRDYPSPRRSYAMAPTGTVLGRPSCVKRLSRATRTCNSTTCRSNVRAITRWPRRLKQCILVSTRLLR